LAYAQCKVVGCSVSATRSFQQCIYGISCTEDDPLYQVHLMKQGLASGYVSALCVNSSIAGEFVI